MTLLEVENLSVEFVGEGAPVRAVDGVSFTLERGEVLCLLGESGCGKTAMLRSIIRLHPGDRTRLQGRVLLNGGDMNAMARRELDRLRGKSVAMVFQDASLAFDPIYRIGDQFIEAMRRHESISRRQARDRAIALLEMARIPSPERSFDSYPFELSGGMAQRAMLALALACDPLLLLADEPTTALDATVQIQILLLLREIQRRTGMGMILVTHDIGVAAEMADRVAVMYAGRIVESGSVRDVLRKSRHPYTKGLLATVNKGMSRGELLPAIEGSPPDLARLPRGCSFAPRCPRAADACLAQAPEVTVVDNSHTFRCYNPEP
jgi:peptide/nickel transport system ATP-binding protein